MFVAARSRCKGMPVPASIWASRDLMRSSLATSSWGVVLLAFVLMTLRSVGVLKRHWRQGHSVLERPENM